MSDLALPPGQVTPGGVSDGHGRPHMDAKPHAAAIIIFLGLLVGGVLYTLYGLSHDVTMAGGETLATGVFVLLGIALLIALGFEFVNGFHDTANAVATVIYTHSLPAQVAVLWSGSWNFIGVLTSSGAVAFSIVSLFAGRADPAGGQRRRIRDDLRAADRGHHLEPRHLVDGSARQFVTHPDRLDHRRGPLQPAAVKQRRVGDRLGLGMGRLQGAADQPRRRLHLLGAAAAGHEEVAAVAAAIQIARGAEAAADLGARPADPDLHRPSRSRTAPTTGRRAWASSCSS